jgi:hypothetical protein
MSGRRDRRPRSRPVSHDQGQERAAVDQPTAGDRTLDAGTDTSPTEHQPITVEISPAPYGPAVMTRSALYPGCDIVLRLHPLLTVRTGTSAAELHAAALAACREARSVHILDGEPTVRRDVALVLASGLASTVTWHRPTRPGAAAAPRRIAPRRTPPTPRRQPVPHSGDEPATIRARVTVERGRPMVHPPQPAAGANVVLDLGKTRRESQALRLAVLRACRSAAGIHVVGGAPSVRGHLVELFDAAGFAVTWEPLNLGEQA